MQDTDLYIDLIAQSSRHFGTDPALVMDGKKWGELATTRQAVWHWLHHSKGWTISRIKRAAKGKVWGTVYRGAQSYQCRIDVGTDPDPDTFLEISTQEALGETELEIWTPSTFPRGTTETFSVSL